MPEQGTRGARWSRRTGSSLLGGRVLLLAVLQLKPLLILLDLSVLGQTEPWHRYCPTPPSFSSCVLQHPLRLSFLWTTR